MACGISTDDFNIFKNYINNSIDNVNQELDKLQTIFLK